MPMPARRGLVVEEMPTRQGKRHAFRLPRHIGILKNAREPIPGQCPHDRDDARVLRLPRRAQGRFVLEQDGVEGHGRIGLAHEARQPDPVRDHKVVQGGVEGTEKGAPVLPVGVLGQRISGLIKPSIGPTVVTGKMLDIGGADHVLWRPIFSRGRRAGAAPRQSHTAEERAMVRAFLLFNALAFGLFGANALIDPVGLTGGLGVEVSGPHGSFEMRGIYGGVSLGGALLCLFGAFRRDLARPALIFMLTYTGGYVFARAVALGLVAVSVETLPQPIFFAFIAFEVVIAVLAAILLMRRPETA